MDKIGCFIIQTLIIIFFLTVTNCEQECEPYFKPKYVRSYYAHPNKDILLVGANKGIYLVFIIYNKYMLWNYE